MDWSYFFFQYERLGSEYANESYYIKSIFLDNYALIGLVKSVVCFLKKCDLMEVGGALHQNRLRNKYLLPMHF